MSDIASADLVGNADACLGAEVALPLDHNDNPVTWQKRLLEEHREKDIEENPTDSGSPLLLQHVDAFDDRGAGVVDAIKHRLGQSAWA